jgi:hypothetical protein
LAAPPDHPIHQARAEMERRSAARAIDDPRQLSRAARIVKCALERRRLELADVLPDEPDGDEAA